MTGTRPDLAVLRDPTRISAVERLVGQGPPGERVEELAALAATVLQSPFAQVSLLGRDEQVIAARFGPPLASDERRGPLEENLCSITAASGKPLVVEDAVQHP